MDFPQSDLDFFNGLQIEDPDYSPSALAPFIRSAEICNLYEEYGPEAADFIATCLATCAPRLCSTVLNSEPLAMEYNCWRDTILLYVLALGYRLGFDTGRQAE